MLNKLRRNLPDVDADDLLERIGLERRRSTTETLLPALGLFGAGVLLGVGLGMMLAPKSGAALRDDVRQRLNRGQSEEETPLGV